MRHPDTAPRPSFAAEPERERPDSPPESYGVPRSGGQFVAWDHVVRRLTDAEGYWLATVTPSGRPHVVPIWGVMVDGDLYLETGAPETVKNRNLARNRNVAVHLDEVTDTIIVRGTAEPTRPAHATLGAALAAAFRAKYPGYEPEPNGWDHGGLYRVAPSSVLAWGDMSTATRWRWQGDPPSPES